MSRPSTSNQAVLGRTGTWRASTAPCVTLCLDRELMLSVAEARVVIEDYRRHYNEERPHGGLGYRTPIQAFMEAQALDAKVA